MKKFFAIVAIVALAFACKEPQNVLSLANAEDAELAYGVKGGEKTVVFSTDAAWTATADQSWVTVEPASGVAGEAIELTISVPENTSYDNLTATVTIAAGNAAPVQIAVAQSQLDEVNVGELEVLTIGHDGGEVELPVNHNIECTVTSDADWAVVEGTRALTTTKHVIKVAKNRTGAERVATLTVEAEGFDAMEVILKQESNISTVFSVNSTTVIPQIGTVTITDGTQTAGVVSIALFDGKLVVCPGDGSMPKLVDKKTGAVVGDLATGGFVPYYVANDDAGNLVMTTRVHNNVWTGEFLFEVWYLKPGSTTAVKALTADWQTRHNGCGMAVRGDITKKAAILVPSEMPGGGGTSEVNGWDFVDGTPGAFQPFAITGFDGMKDNFGAPNFWSGAPNNLNSFALLGTTVAEGAIMLATYPDNGIYSVVGANATKLAADIFGWDGISNATDLIYVNNAPYVAFIASAGFPHWGGLAKIQVYTQTATSFDLIGVPATTSYYTSEGPLTTSDVCLEAVEGGINVYYICNSTTALEGFFIAL